MTTYHWTDSSALYQVKNGDLADDRTESAFRYLGQVAADPASEAEVRSLAHNLLDVIRELRSPGHDQGADFISSVASNALVHEDFDEGNHVFNHVVRDAREVADLLGISYSPGEDPDEDPGAFA